MSINICINLFEDGININLRHWNIIIEFKGSKEFNFNYIVKKIILFLTIQTFIFLF